MVNAASEGVCQGRFGCSTEDVCHLNFSLLVIRRRLVAPTVGLLGKRRLGLASDLHGATWLGPGVECSRRPTGLKQGGAAPKSGRWWCPSPLVGGSGRPRVGHRRDTRLPQVCCVGAGEGGRGAKHMYTTREVGRWSRGWRC